MIARKLMSIVVFLASGTTLSGTELINTLPATTDVHGTGINNFRAAQSFRTTATDNIVTDVTLKLFTDATIGTVKFSIYDGTGAEGSPGALITDIFSGVVTDLPTISYQDFHLGGLNVSLDFESQYYIVAETSVLNDPEVFVFWRYTTSPPPGSHGETSVYWQSTNGLTWDRNIVGEPQLMRVVAIPEPGTYILSSIAVILLAIAGKRRRRIPAAG